MEHAGIIFGIIWVLGTIAFFGHEIWIYYKHPMIWENREEGLTHLPDWQVWLTMAFWPVVLIPSVIFATAVYISTNRHTLFERLRFRKG